MIKVEISEEEYVALGVLRALGTSVVEAAMLARDALDCVGGRVAKARDCLRIGAEQMRQSRETVGFAKAVEAALEVRQNRRRRTVVDFRCYCKRLMKCNPGLERRRVRSMTSAECRRCLEKAFGNSPSQYKKARAVLSGVFSTAVKQGWCDANPVASVPVPEVKEREIHPLRREEVEALERTAEMPEHAGMQLSLHLMLYCGIRPTEVSRINPERDIDWQRGLVLVRPAVSKTGGGRVVPLRNAGLIGGRSIPSRWQERWRALRRAAGWGGQGNPWVPDVCRHTFASYHAAYYRDLPALQVEMGHRDCSLLRTRYIMACLGMEPDWYWERGGGKSANPLTNA